MAKLKEHILNQEQHSRLVFDNLRDAMLKAKELNHAHNSAVHQQEEFLFKQTASMRVWKNPVSVHRLNNIKHQSTQTWSADMPDLEGEALADAEKQFDYDSWLGEHGIGE
jgi:hypothetical protein